MSSTVYLVEKFDTEARHDDCRGGQPEIVVAANRLSTACIYSIAAMIQDNLELEDKTSDSAYLLELNNLIATLPRNHPQQDFVERLLSQFCQALAYAIKNTHNYENVLNDFKSNSLAESVKFDNRQCSDQWFKFWFDKINTIGIYGEGFYLDIVKLDVVQ